MTEKNTEVYGFASLLRAEWTQFRTVRGWINGMVIAALLTVLPGLLLTAVGSKGGRPILVGPGGTAVTDKFYFVHQSLTGDGSIAVRVTSLTGLITYPPPDNDKIVPGVVPWAKVGIMVKDGTKQGSAYAAVMVTGNHGVRMQYNFTADIAGRPGGASSASPRWLRLTRSGHTITGYESMDGKQWIKLGAAQLAELPATLQIGLFVTSPGDVSVSEAKIRFTNATAVFDRLELQGEAPSVAWRHDDIGIGTDLPDYLFGGVKESGGTFTVTGSGDIAPLGVDGIPPIERSLIGVLTGMVAVIVVAVLYVTAEYRRDPIRNMLAVSQRRDRVLAAKAIVIGVAAFVAGLAAAIVAVPLSKHLLRNHVLPVPLLTELRVMFGTAALLAVTAIFAVALASLFRRRVAAVTIGITVVVLPYILANVLTFGTSQWLLRLSPAAGFAIQQSIPKYPQVISLYMPQLGYYPLTPWAGFAVLCGYSALALGLAVFILRRRDT